MVALDATVEGRVVDPASVIDPRSERPRSGTTAVRFADSGILSCMSVTAKPTAHQTTGSEPVHRPVLLTEATAALRARAGGMYLDATFGGGGHTRALLAASAPDGVVMTIDADPSAIERAHALAKSADGCGRVIPVQANFAALHTEASDRGVLPFDGILFDLGLSSFQLDSAERGFAFRLVGPLDMRFDPAQGVPASDLVNGLSADGLADILFTHGEEPRSRRIAAAIVKERSSAPILTTEHLANVVQTAVGGRRGNRTHPATRSFQALRIAVNNELQVLEQGLEAAVASLAPGGRLAVISFHSLEDRIVKRFIAARSATCICPPELPVCMCDTVPTLRRIGGSLRPGQAELQYNPRARSAVLRVAERLKDDQALGGIS